MRRALATSVLVAALSGCSDHTAPDPAPADPSEAAVRLFRLDETTEANRSRFGLVLDLSPEEADDPGPALREALRPLREHTTLEVVGKEALPSGAVAVTLRAGLPGGGVASWIVHAVEHADGTWRVAWFGGPEASWPTSRTRGEGLTVSSPPEGVIGDR